jgi:hypothetical protein
MHGRATICAGKEFDTPEESNRQFHLDETFLFLREAIHSAVRVFTGEADEIAELSLAVFAVKHFQSIKSHQKDLIQSVFICG